MSLPIVTRSVRTNKTRSSLSKSVSNLCRSLSVFLTLFVQTSQKAPPTVNAIVTGTVGSPIVRVRFFIVFGVAFLLHGRFEDTGQYPVSIYFTSRQNLWVPTQKPKPCRQRTRLGKNVAAIRRKCGLTQERLAEMVEVSAWYIQSVERGMNFPSLPVLARFKTALKCSWNRLFSGIDDAN